MTEHASPAQRRWVNRAVAREVDRDRARWLWRAFLVMLLAAAPFAAYLLEQNECLKLSYEASALRQRREDLMERERRLLVQRAAQESLTRIEAWAQSRQGLVHPAPQQVLVVHPSPPQRSRGRALQDAAP